MKVLYITSDFEPEKTACAIRAKAHIDALLENGVEVTVLTGTESSDGTGYTVLNVGVGQPSNLDGFLVRMIKEIRFGISIGFKVLLSRGFDQAVISSPPFFATLIASFFLRLKRLPYSVDVRDRYPQVLFSLGVLGRSSLTGRLLSGMERSLYGRARKVITVTKGLVEAIGGDLPGVDVRLAMNGFRTEDRVAPDEFAAYPPFRIVIHGNFSKFFDIDVFLSILHSLQSSGTEFLFTLAGWGSKFEALKQLRLERVEILDNLDDKALSALLKEAHLGMSIRLENESERHAFPVKVFDFIGHNLPSIIIPKNEAGILIQGENMGFTFASSEWAEAAKTIQALASNPSLYLTLRRTVANKAGGYSRKIQARSFAGFIADQDSQGPGPANEDTNAP